jgi:hypothetical protein
MHTDMHLGSDRGSRASAPDRRALSPVVARALELGHGPPALVRWLSGQVANGRPATADVARLAAELGQVVRQAGVAETRVE